MFVVHALAVAFAMFWEILSALLWGPLVGHPFGLRQSDFQQLRRQIRGRKKATGNPRRLARPGNQGAWPANRSRERRRV